MNEEPTMDKKMQMAVHVLGIHVCALSIAADRLGADMNGLIDEGATQYREQNPEAFSQVINRTKPIKLALSIAEAKSITTLLQLSIDYIEATHGDEDNLETARSTIENLKRFLPQEET